MNDRTYETIVAEHEASDNGDYVLVLKCECLFHYFTFLKVKCSF